jgi:ATP-dependent RNA helicase RhlB
LLDFNSQEKLSFKNIGFLVIDEADRMLDMGFFPDIEKIVRRSSERGKRQTMLFSATLDSRTRELARDFMNGPASIRIKPEEVTVDKVTQVMYHVNSDEKINLVLGILQKEKPRNTLIFTNMKRDAEILARHLEHNGLKCLHISGDLSQKRRLSVLEKFKSGHVPILVATDVAARGLHIDDLEMIINFDLPGDCENYVHRIGRTARAGKSGKAITLACDKYIYNLEPIEELLNQKIPVEFADDEMYPVSSSEGMRFESHKKGGRSRRGSAARSSRKKKTDWPRRKESGRKQAKEKIVAADTQEKGNGKKKRKSKRQRSHKPPGSSVQDRMAYYKKKYGENFDLQA